jgi:uncharacterized membrane protein YfcA
MGSDGVSSRIAPNRGSPGRFSCPAANDDPSFSRDARERVSQPVARMLSIYLPIAETSVDVILILVLGGGIGFLSGVFGVGGGFLMTPLLILIGIPAGVSVATSANQIVASSVSGVLAHWRRGNVDFKMGLVLVVGGFIGSTLGVGLFGLLQAIGQLDLIIHVGYVLLLGTIGALMLYESLGTLLRAHRSTPVLRKLHEHNFLHGLPIKTRFRRSRLYISIFLPLSIGGLTGVMTAILGIGGGFIIVPAMVYILRMPTNVVIGTSLFQIIFVTANVTFLQSVTSQSVDVVLAILLLVGAVVGAQYGAKIGARLKGEQLRALLAVIILGVCLKVGVEMISAPVDTFAVEILH